MVEGMNSISLSTLHKHSDQEVPALIDPSHVPAAIAVTLPVPRLLKIAMMPNPT